MKTIEELVYEYLPYEWGWEDAVDLREDVRADIRAHEKAAVAAAFTVTAQECMHRARRLWAVYDVLEVLVEKYPFITVEDACAQVQAKREECNG